MDEELEARYAALQAQADAMNCDLIVSLIVGGVMVNELYNVRPVPDEVETLAGQLDTMERILADPRTATVAQASNRMTYAEELGKQIAGHVKERQEQYRVAQEAFRSVSSDPPPDDTQDVLDGMLVTMAREDDLLDSLIATGIERIVAQKQERRAQAKGETAEPAPEQ